MDRDFLLFASIDCRARSRAKSVREAKYASDCFIPCEIDPAFEAFACERVRKVLGQFEAAGLEAPGRTEKCADACSVFQNDCSRDSFPGMIHKFADGK